MRTKPKLWSVLLYAVALVCVFNFSSCKNDDIPDDSYYTFVGETASDFLQNHPDFSLYNQIVDRCQLSAASNGTKASLRSLLASYGHYTVFAPDNNAVETYLEKYGLASIEELSDSAVNLIALMHVINSTNRSRSYETKYFTRKLPDLNMYDKVIYLETVDTTYQVNSMARILTRDLEVHNGCVHQIGTVLEPSDKKLGDFFAENPQYSVFRVALEATGVADRVNTVPEDYDYVKDETDYKPYQFHDLHIETPDKRKLFYTCFVEPNSVYEAAIPELRNATSPSDTLALLQAYALNWFKSAYSDATAEVDSAVNDAYKITDPRNYFNRFVAYHFVNKKIDRTDFTRYVIGLESNYARIKEYAETLAPGQMVYMSAGKNGNSLQDPNLLQLNPSPDNEVPFFDGKDWTRPSKDGVLLTSDDPKLTENGFFHELTSILTYPRKDFMKMRFRFDISSLFPEVMSNDFRYKYTEQGRIVFPNDYLTNIDFLSKGTVLLMISPNKNATSGYNGLQGDEFFAYNTYDFILRLPPVPAGQYEVRLGFSASDARGCAQFYLGLDPDNMVPCGIPVDLTQTANKYGWVDDKGTEEDYEVDKVMRAGGWMKSPDSWLCCNGNNKRSLRATENSSGTGHSPLRHILGVVNLQQDGHIYVRARNATVYESVELMMDFFEICPANIYDNPIRTEPRD